MIEEYEPPSTKDGSKSFQSNNERSQSPGKLKWGKDFNFAKQKRSK